MKYRRLPDLDKWFLNPTLRNALNNVAKNHLSEVELVIDSMLKIYIKYYSDENQMKKFSKVLQSLCDTYYLPLRYDERLLVKQSDSSIRQKVSLDRIAEELRISRSKLLQDIHNYRFKNNPKYYSYIKHRQAYLLLYSLFFEVSPWYIMGLTMDKYDYEGLFDLMVIGNLDIYACYKLMGAAFTHLELDQKVNPDLITKYISLLEPLKNLAVFLDNNNEETGKQCCLAVWHLLMHIPLTAQYSHEPLPIKTKTVNEEIEYFHHKLPFTTHTCKFFITENQQLCERIGKANLRILIAFAMLVYYNKWELLEGIKITLKNGCFQL